MDYPIMRFVLRAMLPKGQPTTASSFAERASAWLWQPTKVPGIRAANIVNTEFAALCREHNDANVLTLSGRFVGLEDNKEIVRVFLSTAFGGGRHAQRVEKIMALDEL